VAGGKNPGAIKGGEWIKSVVGKNK
jgi:hypothetical protein